MNLELIVTDPVLVAVKNYDLNLPEICIKAILTEIERLNDISSAVVQTTASREEEILELRNMLEFMREKLEKAEAVLGKQRHSIWNRPHII